MSSFRKCITSLLTLVFVAFSTVVSAGNITARIDIADDWIDATQDVRVNITLTNESNRPARVLKWYTAAQGIEENLFLIHRDGQSLRYLGAHYKRPAPQAADYIQLKAGASITHTAELSAVYDFSKSGEYSLKFNVESLQLFNPSDRAASLMPGQKRPSIRVEQLTSNTETLWVQGRKTDWGKRDPKKGGNGGGKPGTEPPPSGERITFSGRCSNEQQTTILSAIDEAIAISADSQSYMNNNLGNRYNTWFGSANTGRENTVAGNFDAISSAMSTAEITVDCKCKQSYYAYVYPTQPYKIYVCRAFWNAPLVGTDSKAGTLVHEMSHFDVVSGTDDVVYGQTGAKNLAISNPDDAIRNADSHEYFAENTPHSN